MLSGFNWHGIVSGGRLCCEQGGESLDSISTCTYFIICIAFN